MNIELKKHKKEMVKSKYFSEREFNNCTPSCSLQNMNQDAMVKFDRLRALAGIPLVINSAYRTRDYERSKGRSGTSAHCDGVAIDIRCRDSNNRMKIVQALIRSGCRRFGVYDTFIHVDWSKTHQQDVLWTK